MQKINQSVIGQLVEKGEPLERAQSRLHNSDRAHHARPPSSSDIYGPRERNSKKSYMGRGDAVQMDEVKQARKSKNLVILRGLFQLKYSKQDYIWFTCHAQNLTTFNSNLSRLFTRLCSRQVLCPADPACITSCTRKCPTETRHEPDQVESSCSALPSLSVQEQCTLGNLEFSGSRIWDSNISILGDDGLRFWGPQKPLPDSGVKLSKFEETVLDVDTRLRQLFRMS